MEEKSESWLSYFFSANLSMTHATFSLIHYTNTAGNTLLMLKSNFGNFFGLEIVRDKVFFTFHFLALQIKTYNGIVFSHEIASYLEPSTLRPVKRVLWIYKILITRKYLKFD